MKTPPVPIIASRKPYLCTLKGGRTIAWCRCGQSKRQPYCDGRSHKDTGFEPLLYTAGQDDEEVLLCGCKHTGTPPFCDGTHSNLPGGYLGDQRSDDERGRLRRAVPDAEGLSRLDGACYVISPAAVQLSSSFWSRKIIAPSLGAEHQSQFYISLNGPPSPHLCVGTSDAILFIAHGSGIVEIAGHVFPVKEEDGVYIRPGETFSMTGDGPMRVFVSALPAVESLQTLKEPGSVFDADYPVRVRGVDAAQRSEMGPRYFQMLVDKSVGSVNAAQFIGHIPQSRAEMHRHLYEEALIILAGEGTIWNDGSCAAVAAGDVIFLPRKHAHSLECVSPEGMEVVGVIYPGDNPGINY